jgi:hypothetical protein
MAASNWTSSSRRTVVGYFADGEDAHRAINDLLTEGFRPSEIGAAFHTTGTQAAKTSAMPVEEIQPPVGPIAVNAGSSTAGAASDSSAVTPAGLSTGSGTATSGATRPGPIPGAEIPSGLPSTLPHTIKSTLPSSLHPNPDAPMAPPRANASYPATGGLHEVRKADTPGWWEKLTQKFSSGDAAGVDRQSVSDKTSTNFGTGEGHLGAYPDYDYAYSSQAFESAFFGMGIPSTHARQLSGMIRRGGAIVTVDAAALNAEAEKIFERNNGTVRYEASDPSSPSSLASEDAWEEANGEARVRLLGRVQQAYPGYVSSSGTPTRKAS